MGYYRYHCRLSLVISLKVSLCNAGHGRPEVSYFRVDSEKRLGNTLGNGFFGAKTFTNEGHA